MISLEKKYKSKDGREIKIYAVDNGGRYSVHGAIEDDDKFIMRTWTREGLFQFAIEGDSDLIEIKPRIKRTGWSNVYKNGECGSIHNTKEKADDISNGHRLACVKIEIDCEEGEGLDD